MRWISDCMRDDYKSVTESSDAEWCILISFTYVWADSDILTQPLSVYGWT